MDSLRQNIDRNELKKGDHIYSWRLGYLYSHCHGIYVDDGKVIQFTGARGLPSSPEVCTKCGGGDLIRDSGVISTCLDCFLDGGELYRFQYGVSKAEFCIKVRGKCTTAASDRDADNVVRRAEFLLDKNGFGTHDFVSHYSKHFALYCKTEKLLPKSGGLDWMNHTLKSLMNVCTVVINAAQSSPIKTVSAVSDLLNARYNNDIGVRDDVKQIAVEDLAHHFAASDDAQENDA